MSEQIPPSTVQDEKQRTVNDLIEVPRSASLAIVSISRARSDIARTLQVVGAGPPFGVLLDTAQHKTSEAGSCAPVGPPRCP